MDIYTESINQSSLQKFRFAKLPSFSNSLYSKTPLNWPKISNIIKILADQSELVELAMEISNVDDSQLSYYKEEVVTEIVTDWDPN